MVGRLRKGVGVEIFKKWESKFPGPMAEIKALKNVSTEYSRSGDLISLRLTANWNEPVTDPLWIPDSADGVLFAEQELESGELSHSLSRAAKPVPGSGFSGGTIKGILTFVAADGSLQGTPVWFKSQ